jgi:CDP-6-deoxy-D-xylo-4-hexulose-3-dehydrase
MVNSGSSANLMAFEVLRLPPGSEVITPALTFSTTLAPIVQKGLVPVFADVGLGTYVVESAQIEPLITKKTKALMIPSLIGNLPDFAALRAIAKKHGLYFIEDSCDTVGPRFAGKPTGAYTDISTTSFYASHIMTAAGGGGMVMFHDAALAR